MRHFCLAWIQVEKLMGTNSISAIIKLLGAGLIVWFK